MAPTKPDETGGLWAKLRLALEMRVCLRVNLNVGDKLANGSLGTLKGWVKDLDQKVKYLFIDFDSVRGGKIGTATRLAFLKKEARLIDSIPSIKAMLNAPNSNIIPIGLYTTEFPSINKRHRLRRTMFPIAVSFASTIHR